MSYNCNSFKIGARKGFTLAEVLITIGIIGVVASITIPNLIFNVQKRIWTNRLIKVQAELSQTFKMLMAKDNTTSLTGTSAWGSMTEMCDAQTNLRDDVCKGFREGFLSVLNHGEFTTLSTLGYPEYISKLTKEKSYASNSYVGILLPSGALIKNARFRPVPQVSEFSVSKKERVANISIDINGIAKPNTYGRDIFVFDVYDDGSVEPRGSRNWSEFYCGDRISCSWEGDEKNSNCRPDLSNQKGEGCAGRVLEKRMMDY